MSSLHHIPDGLFHEVSQLYAQGHTSEEILSRLLKRNIDMDVAESVMSKVKAMRHAKSRSRGLIFCGIGSVLLVMAFLITYILHQFGYNTDWSLYGFTTLGVTCLFTGMVFFFG